MWKWIKKLFGSAQDRLLQKYFKTAKEINAWEEKFQLLSDEEIRGKTEEFKERLKSGATLDDLLPEAYAVVKNVCRRLVGSEVHVFGYDQKWDMIPYDVQLVGAIALHYGTIAEMQTGEGKTLTAAMPLYLNALTGKPVHLVTVNDYLAARDRVWNSAIFEWLGLATASLTADTPPEARKGIYAADIVYGTSSEFGFDYLRDNSMSFSADQQVQRGYYFAIIDEVDSILIDEARTPLIISGPAPEGRQLYEELKSGVDELVAMQRNYSNRLANEAKRILDELGILNQETIPDKVLNGEKGQEALIKLWLVSRSTPHNKILKRMKEQPDLRAALDRIDIYYHSDQNREERSEKLSELYILIDEKTSEFELTDKGIQGWEICTQGKGKADDFVMLDISDEFLKIDDDKAASSEEKEQRKLAVQEEDSKRKERAHNLRQMLRAHLLMEKDVDYIVQEGKVVIIDENTGRPQPGRRFSDGLHQAIEAKEGVEIQKETQTYATITLQNFFRMYEKLAGMTGTASTEAGEFKQIYKIDVLEIPTHKPCMRSDFHDEIYMTEREKYNAILKDVKEIHEKGRPILIGTESVEVSEKLSRIFRQNRLDHTVLNAKQNEKEAEVIASAGMKGAITISTNMAGRGTDIKLSPGVADVGGLFVIGSTRHQSRRIDRQLRGRCARQGDPGTSKFYICFEDALLRLFASPRLNTLLQRFRPPEGEPISASILNKSIETAQKRIEQRNYTMRKHTLEYDDVMNKQRQEVYSFRNEIIKSHDPENLAEEMIEGVVVQIEEESESEGENSQTFFFDELMRFFPVTLEADGSVDEAIEKIQHAFKEKLQREVRKFPDADEGAWHRVQGVLKHIMIQRLDKLWQRHLLEMDHLRHDVLLRAVGQRDPLMEFKQEAFYLFERFSRELKKEILHDLFRFEFIQPDVSALQKILSELHLEKERSFLDQTPETLEEAAQEASLKEVPRVAPLVAGPRSGRNDLCPCGSGKKYKKCCGVQEEITAPGASK